jgi:hypothetical protein
MFRSSSVGRAAAFVSKPRTRSDVLVTCICHDWAARKSSHAAAEEALRQHVEYDCPAYSARLTARHYANFKTVEPLRLSYT